MNLLKRYYGFVFILIGLSMPIKGAYSATVSVPRWQSVSSQFLKAAQQYAWRNKYAIGAGLGFLGVGGMRWYNQKQAEIERQNRRKKDRVWTSQEQLAESAKLQRLQVKDPQAANRAALQAFQKQRDLIEEEEKERMKLEGDQKDEHLKEFEKYYKYHDYKTRFKYFISSKRDLFCSLVQEFKQQEDDLWLNMEEEYPVDDTRLIVVEKDSQDVLSSFHPNALTTIDGLIIVDRTYPYNSFFQILVPLPFGSKFESFKSFNTYQDFYARRKIWNNVITDFGDCSVEKTGEEFEVNVSSEEDETRGLFEGLLYSILHNANNQLGDWNFLRTLKIFESSLKEDSKIIFVCNQVDHENLCMKKTISPEGKEVYKGYNQAGKMLRFLFKEHLFAQLVEREEPRFASLRDQLKRYLHINRSDFTEKELYDIKPILQEPLK